MLTTSFLEANQNKKLAYIVSDIRIPFWEIMSQGMKKEAMALGYELELYSSGNVKKTELESVVKAIKSDVLGLIISPISSSTSATILKLAKNANMPIVISDIGTDAGEYVSYISSNNTDGAYGIGKILAKKMKDNNWENGTVGIIAIPQKRENGKARTSGFMKAMNEEGIKGAALKQQITFSYEETYDYAIEMIKNNPKLRAIWLQGSDRYKAALQAIEESGKKDEILLICFDAETEFLELIPKGVIVGAAMQQPYLMGKEAVLAMDMYLKGKKVKKNIQLPILAISKENINSKINIIKKNVLGIETQTDFNGR